MIALRDSLRSDYERTLKLARLGVLPFFVAASFLVWVWARRLFGDPASIAAVFLFQGLPLVLAHAGLVGTDMALTALLPAALYLLVLWLERPSILRSALLGLVVGLAVLAKHSALPFLFVGAAPIAALRSFQEHREHGEPRFPLRRRFALLSFAGIVFFSVAWAGYRFSWNPAAVPANRPHQVLRLPVINRLLSGRPQLAEAVDRVVESPIPLGDLIRGARLVFSHAGVGHPAFLLGEVRERGWWYFFPVLIAVRTPIPFLVFAVVGAISLRGAGPAPGWWRFAPLLAAAGILLVGLASRIDIGLRHLLPIFPMLAIVAGAGLCRLVSQKQHVLVRSGVLALAAWFVASSALAHPDYLPYFNEIAGGHPERIVVDSDLDWGQDVKRLFAALRQLNASEVSYACLRLPVFEGNRLAPAARRAWQTRGTRAVRCRLRLGRRQRMGFRRAR